MAAEALDFQHLTSFSGVPQHSLETLLDAPTLDLIRTFLQAVAHKAREHEEIQSENLRLSVELENAVRGKETQQRVHRTSTERSQHEITELREKLQSAEQSRATLQNEFEALKLSTSSSVKEVANLQTRISALESSSRDTVSLLESKTAAYDNLASELTDQHQKVIELRREVSTLEQSIQSAKSEVSAAKFGEQGLQQEMEHHKRNNDWLDTELKTKSAEHAKYRKEKTSRITELQRENDDLSSNRDAQNRTEKTLRTRLDEIGQKADDAFSRIQQLEEEAARKEESFTIELNAANRLTELSRNSAKTERQRQQELQDELETVKDDASREIARLVAECETEHHGKESAEKRIAALEVHIESLEGDVAMLHDQGATIRTASPVINGSMTPQRIASQSASPSPAKSRGGISVTHLYSENNRLKGELVNERRKNEKLNNTIDEMMQDIESKQPELEELNMDHARLEAEVAEMSNLVDSVGKERDQAVKDARRHEGQAEARMKEGHVLRQQLRDQSSQIKLLTMQNHLRAQGLEDISAEQSMQMERLAQAQSGEDGLESSTDTDRYISQNLVTFKNVVELQEQNSKLLKVTRELGDRMERDEAEKKRSLKAAETHEELQHKHNLLKDEIKALVTQSQSYIRERDTFKKMLFNRSKGPNSNFAASVDGDAPATPVQTATNSIDGSPSGNDIADYSKLLKDMQAHFDAYRQEASTDHSTLKQQVDSLSKSNSELRGEAARSSSQVSLAHERYNMLHDNYGMLKTENSELQKRSQFFSDNAAKQEMRTQQVAEDLVEARALAESMRNENANLKAEKDFWKGVEKRINEENGSLRQEQTRLNGMVASMQSLLNERERSDNEARRRLQTQIETLEQKLGAAKQRLAEEVEENKRTLSRREYDNQQNQKRIDDLIASLGSTREEYAASKTKCDHLQNRIDELTIELRSAEERVSVLQPAPTHGPSPDNGRQSSQGSLTEEPSSTLSKEQSMAVQILELKRDLSLTKGELENAKVQIEQYKAISQSSEEELASMNETHDLYRHDMDRLVNEKDAKIRDLEARISDTSAELASTNAELSDLRTAQAENNRRMEELKTTFEVEIAQLKDQSDRHASAVHFYQEDLKVQAEIAQHAQQNYENELVKHADAAKSLQKVRGEHNQLKMEVVEIKAEADSAKSSLVQSEESWAESKQRYEREILDLKAGRDGLNAQNSRLHKQLDDVGAQIANLQKRPPTEENEESGLLAPSAGMENLQEVIKYLRREKEIIDVQLELSSQEAKRLKQQLEYTQTQLDETRLRLNQQRRREEEGERTSLKHNKLMETIDELSTFRESNVTLRNETKQAQASLSLKSQQVEELLAQVQPLQVEVRNLKNEIETQAGEATLLREDRERWQQRTQDILKKYDRIDPAEMEALKDKIQGLENERNTMSTEKSALQERFDSISTQLIQAQEHGNQRVEELRQKLTEQFKNRSKQLSGRIAEKEQALQAALKDKTDIEQRLITVQEELNTANLEKENLAQKMSSQVQSGNSRPPSEGEEGQLDEAGAEKPTNAQLDTLKEQIAAAEEKAREETSRNAALQQEVATDNTKISELESQINDMQQKLDSTNEILTKLQGSQQQGSTSSAPAEGVSEESIEKLRQELAQAQQEAETLRASAASNTSRDDLSSDESGKPPLEQVNERVELIRAELESQHKHRLAQLEENFTNRTNSMKGQLQSRLTEGKEKYRQSVAIEHEQAIQKLTSDHQRELESLERRHRDEIEDLKRQQESSFSQFKDSWIAEHPKTSDGAQEVKAEDQASRPITQITDEEAKYLVQSNEKFRNVLRQNIAKQVEAEKEKITAQAKEAHEKEMTERLSEAQSKANTAKEQAVSMETKKNYLKVNMAENKARIAQAKIEVVRTAASETPSKPVAEVWAIAKDVKASATPQASQSTRNGLTPQQAAPSAGSTSSGQPSAIPQGNQPSAPTTTTAVSGFGKPSTFGQPSGPQQQASSSPASKPTPTGPSQPTSAANIPQRQPHGANNPLVQGTGPAALRGLQQSGLPVARGGSTRGRGSRGGRGQGRGGPQSIDTSQSQGQGQLQGRSSPQQGSNSPVSAGLNATAKQFVPGNKRPREDGGDGGQVASGNGKRIRGGADS